MNWYNSDTDEYEELAAMPTTAEGLWLLPYVPKDPPAARGLFDVLTKTGADPVKAYTEVMKRLVGMRGAQ